MVAERDEDLDLIGLAEDELEAAVQVFHVRKGRGGSQGFHHGQGGGSERRSDRGPDP